MANSEVTFYRVNFERDLNPYVDDLDNYLNHLDTRLVNSNFQYIRHDLHISIKLNLNQDESNDFYYNYCKIKNNDDNINFYYYVDKPVQNAQNTNVINLTLDTVNTLGQGSGDYCNPRNFNNETHITRQHKDRFKRQTTAFTKLKRVIDVPTEGLTPNKKKISDVELQDDLEYATRYANLEKHCNWYLVYKSSGDQTWAGIKIYLMPEYSQQALVPSTTTAGAYDVKGLLGFIQLNRVDSKLIKIIKLPYCPFNFTSTRDPQTNNRCISFSQALWNGTFSYEASTTLAGYLSLNTVYIPEFERLIKTKLNLDSELYLTKSSSTIGLTDTKDINRESKLFHSDFYTYKLAYDSFTQEINLENMDVNGTSTEIQVTFKPTNTIDSKFGFQWDFASGTSTTYTDTEDFSRLILSTRNNEEPIFSNEYLNYIKNGYNYDKKTAAMQLEQAKRSAGVNTAATAVNLIGTALSLALAGPTGGASLAPAIAFGVGTVTSGIKTADQWIDVSQMQDKANAALQAKLDQLQAQSASVSATDDLNLMTWYSNNKLHIIKYSILDENQKNMIYKLLDYTGYSDNTYGTPNVDSRIWYNYLQCEPHIQYEGLEKYKTDWVDDLKQRYQAGVTVFHHHKVNNMERWSFERNYENWENWMIQGAN